MTMYDDETKAKMVDAQRKAFALATVTYDRGGFEPATTSGWVSFRQLSVANPASLFGGGSGPVSLMMIPDVNEPGVEQHMTEIPLTRIISVVYAPQLP